MCFQNKITGDMNQYYFQTLYMFRQIAKNASERLHGLKQKLAFLLKSILFCFRSPEISLICQLLIMIITSRKKRSRGKTYCSPFIILITSALSHHGHIIKSNIPGLLPPKKGVPLFANSRSKNSRPVNASLNTSCTSAVSEYP